MKFRQNLGIVCVWVCVGVGVGVGERGGHDVNDVVVSFPGLPSF